MLIAEAVKLDPAVVVVILLVALGAVLGAAVVVGGLGVAAGVALARRTQSPEERQALRHGSAVGAAAGGTAAAAGSWILLSLAASQWSGSAPVTWLILVGGLPLPIVWGWWLARTYRFGNRRGPAPTRPLPPDASGSW